MSQIVTDGLVGYWHHKQGVQGNMWNNIAPNTSGKYNAVVDGAILQDKGVYFDGVDDKWVASGLSGFDVNRLTLETSVIIEKNGNLIGFDASNIINTGFPNNPPSLNIRRRGATNYIANFPPSMGDVRHVVISFDGSIYTGWVDGVRFNTSINLRPNDDPTTISFSAGVGTSPMFGGFLIQARLYNRALSHQEVLQNYMVGSEIGLGIEEPPPPSFIDGATQLTGVSSTGTQGSRIRQSNHQIISLSGLTVVAHKLVTPVLSSTGLSSSLIQPVNIRSDSLVIESKSVVQLLAEAVKSTGTTINSLSSVTVKELPHTLSAGTVISATGAFLSEGSRVLNPVYSTQSLSNLSSSALKILRSTVSASSSSSMDLYALRIVGNSVQIGSSTVLSAQAFRTLMNTVTFNSQGALYVFSANEIVSSIVAVGYGSVGAEGIRVMQGSPSIALVSSSHVEGIRVVMAESNLDATTHALLSSILVSSGRVGAHQTSNINSLGSLILGGGLNTSAHTDLLAESSVVMALGADISAVSSVVSLGVFKEIPGVELMGLLDMDKNLIGLLVVEVERDGMI